MQDALALFDSDGRLVLCNSPYHRLLGDAAPDDVVGMSYTELLDLWMTTLVFANEEERALFRSTRLASRVDPKGAFDVRTRHGRSLRVLDRRSDDGGLVKTIWDLTDDVLLAEELREARATAEAASDAKSEFLSSMSHELRTPLNAILGFAQLLGRDKKEPLSERHKERVSQILRGGEHLLRLIDDVLDLSRIEAGRVSISTEPLAVSEVLNEVRATLEPSAARGGVRISLDSPVPDLPRIHADRTRFVQIVTNFATNAIKYNQPGGSVTVSARPSGDNILRVSVVDTGMGIPVESQDKLFQPFQRAGQETGPIEGTGIGLVITKRLAELMGGRVGFRSSPGKGSEFWVELPGSSARPLRRGQPGQRDVHAGRPGRLRRAGPRDRADGRDGDRAGARAPPECDHHGHQSPGDERPRGACSHPRGTGDRHGPRDRVDRGRIGAGSATWPARRLLPILDQAGARRRAPSGARSDPLACLIPARLPAARLGPRADGRSRPFRARLFGRGALA